MKDWPSFPRRWTKLKIMLKPTLFIVVLLLIFFPTYFQQILITQVYKELEIPSAPVEMNLNFSEPREVYRSHSEAVIDGTRKIAKELIRLNYQMAQLAQEKTDENIPERIKDIDINGVNNNLD